MVKREKENKRGSSFSFMGPLFRFRGPSETQDRLCSYIWQTRILTKWDMINFIVNQGVGQSLQTFHLCSIFYFYLSESYSKFCIESNDLIFLGTLFNMQMVGGSMNPRNRKGDSTNINSLPDDLLVEILLRVPTLDIHENSRLVCGRWYRTIRSDNFVQSHLCRSRAGLLLGKHGGAPTIFVTAPAEGGIEVSKSSYKSGFQLLTSCNGLILGVETYRENAPYIVNPATRTRFDLPPLPDTMFGCMTLNYFGIAYVAASMEYKVVATYCLNYKHSMFAQCAILTVGVDDTWRNVATQQLSPEAKALLCRTPLITEGFVHWAGYGPYLKTFNQRFYGVLSMNVETEIISEVPPLEHRDNSFDYYLSTGRRLSVLIPRGDLLWDVWEMVGETGDWRNLVPNINLRAHKRRISQIHWGPLLPVGWVKYPDVLAFSFDDSPSPCIAYNLGTDEIDSFDLDSKHIISVAGVHRNSLVRLT